MTRLYILRTVLDIGHVLDRRDFVLNFVGKHLLSLHSLHRILVLLGVGSLVPSWNRLSRLSTLMRLVILEIALSGIFLVASKWVSTVTGEDIVRAH